MGRQARIDDGELIGKLSAVFGDVGFQGASMAALAEATGLKKASLYHRFPDGKEQMAREVLLAAGDWMTENILTPLSKDTPPDARVGLLTRRLSRFYSGGKQACLLNLLSSARIAEGGVFAKEIATTFEALISALRKVVMDAGFDKAEADRRAVRSVMLLHGSLVLSRGTGSTRPFKAFLEGLPNDLLGAK